MSDPGRRRVLRSLVGAGVAGLAGCLSSRESTPEDGGRSNGAAETDAGDGTATAASSGGDPSTATSDGSTGATLSGVGGWPNPGHDVRRTNHVPDTTGPTSGVTEQWSASAPQLTSTPVVVGGRVFVTGGGTVSALSAADGSRLWHVETEGQFVAPATVAGDTVVACSSTGRTYALSAADGSERWRVDEVGTTGYGVPLADDGTVFLGGAGSPEVYALSLDDGSTRWKSDAEFGPGYVLTAATDDALLATYGTALVALDRETGEERWRWGADNYYPIRSLPAVRDGTVFVCNKGGLTYAIDAETGEPMWERVLEPMSIGHLALAVTDDRLFVPTDKSLIALDTASGEERWRVEASSPVAPVVADGTVYGQAPIVETDAGFTSYFIAAYSASDGSELWRHSIDDHRPVRVKPAVADGRVFVGSQDGTVYALSEES